MTTLPGLTVRPSEDPWVDVELGAGYEIMPPSFGAGWIVWRKEMRRTTPFDNCRSRWLPTGVTEAIGSAPNIEQALRIVRKNAARR